MKYSVKSQLWILFSCYTNAIFTSIEYNMHTITTNTKRFDLYTFIILYKVFRLGGVAWNRNANSGTVTTTNQQCIYAQKFSI